MSPEAREKYQNSFARDKFLARKARIHFTTDKEDNLKHLPLADILVIYKMKYEEYLQCGRLQWLHAGTAGVNHFFFLELLEKVKQGMLLFTSSRGIHAKGVAGQVFAALMGLAHGLFAADRQRGRGEWNQEEVVEAKFDLRGKILGVFGFGSIGKEAARLGKFFGMKIWVLSPSKKKMAGIRWFNGQKAEGFLSGADVVLLSAPLTNETKGFLNRERLTFLKPSAIVVNVARGDMLDEEAFYEALRRKKIRWGVVDVFGKEPLGPEHWVWKVPNVIYTPHTAGMFPGVEDLIWELFVKNLKRHLAGRPLLNRVDIDKGY